jgi:hypothetical protein
MWNELIVWCTTGTVSLSGIAVGVCFGFRQHQLGASAKFISQFSLHDSLCTFFSQIQPFLISFQPPFVSLNLWSAFFKVHFGIFFWFFHSLKSKYFSFVVLFFWLLFWLSIEGVLLLLLTYVTTQFFLLVVLGLILNLWGIANVVHFVTKGMSRLVVFLCSLSKIFILFSSLDRISSIAKMKNLIWMKCFLFFDVKAIPHPMPLDNLVHTLFFSFSLFLIISFPYRWIKCWNRILCWMLFLFL